MNKEQEQSRAKYTPLV
uniref:Uncharacterized protein n=1 Tax=Rhizophora mucronata TaxID=61149 RepID=A0A2P2JZP3_RHIMU